MALLIVLLLGFFSSFFFSQEARACGLCLVKFFPGAARGAVE